MSSTHRYRAIREINKPSTAQCNLEHCVWGTWERLPLITPDIQEVIYSAIVKQCSDLGCKVIAIGGTVDYIHLLTGFPPKLTISELMQKAKGSSSHLITH